MREISHLISNGRTTHKLSRVRASNLELLRIVSMMLVMLAHYIKISIIHTSTELIQNPIKVISELEIHSISIICVHCFILISGYFGIRWKLKSFLGLLFQILFWGILGFFIYEWLIAPFINISNGISFGSFMERLFISYRSRWFLSAYITLYILSPLINSFVESASERKLLTFTGIFYLYSTIYGYFMLSDEFNAGLSALSMIGLYILGAWLKRSRLKIVNCNKWYDFFGFILCTIIMTGGSAVLLMMGITKSIYGYLNPIVIIESMFLFQFFRKMKMRHVNWINYLASSALAAFLLHCHGIIGPVWNNVCRDIHESDFALLYILIFIIFTFLAATLIDKIRIFIWEILCNICSRMIISK